MASPAVAVPNGLPDSSHVSNEIDMIDAPSPSAMKRKHESTDPDELKVQKGVDDAHYGKVNGASHLADNAKAVIRDFLFVLQRYDTEPSILKRPLLDADSADEPSPKRKKADDGSPLPSITDKAAKDEYSDLEAVASDIRDSVKAQLAELRGTEFSIDTKTKDEAITQTITFGRKAQELFRREGTYPQPTQNSNVLRDLDPATELQSNVSGTMMLTVFGEAPRPRQLYSSLQQPITSPSDARTVYQPLRESGLPNGIKTAKAAAYTFPSAIEKDKKGKTLGELFPAPRNLPSLQPPKAPKSTTKGVQVGWHRPELTEKSKYRAGSYFGQTISTGRWLDYSNAAPPSQMMTKQRERALSLAGNKPSSSDLESSEMEALFRGAFSSFAPSKDDSAAMVSSGLISQTMWWQKVGKRTFDRMIEAEASDAGVADVDEDKEADMVLDDDLIEKAIEDGDKHFGIDPKLLEEICHPQKSDVEKDGDDILQEVSDMIETLISFQKNRNLALPSAANQSRYAADPAHSDMLTNGSPVQPSEEETATYEALKAQLVLVIQMLPPYAVARLNSDQLEELNVSTKLEIRAEEYQGVMEEDEAAARTRAAQQAAANARPSTHRASGSSGGMQYGMQYQGGNRAPMPSQGYYGAQTPVRAPSNIQRPPSSMPPAYGQARPPSTGYRQSNGYPGSAGFSQQLARAQQALSQSNPYSATPPQMRPSYQQQSSYQNVGNANAARFPSGQIPPYQQQAYPQQQQATPSQPPYGAYTNGGSAMPPRNMSPQQPAYMQQGFAPNATPSRQASFSSQAGMPSGTPQQRYFPPASTPLPQGQQTPNQQNSSQPSGYHTSLNPLQVQQAMDQAKARFHAQSKAQRSNESSMNGQGQSGGGAPVGLSGMDSGRMAAPRPGVPATVNYTPSPSPNPQVNSPALSNARPAVNGSPASAAATPSSANGTPALGREA